VQRGGGREDECQNENGNDTIQLLRFRDAVTHKNAPFFFAICLAGRREAEPFFPVSRIRSFPCAVCTHFALRKRLRKTVMSFLESRKKCRW
jgi:hypothetical protein